MKVQANLEWATTWLKSSTPKRLYIGGEWIQSKKTFETINPSNQKPLTEICEATPTEVDLAVRAAREALAHPQWRGVKRRDRSRFLNRIAEVIRAHFVELATLESLDNGKTFTESYVDDLPESADVFDYYAGWTDKLYSETCPTDPGYLNYTLREPVGVCALIVPWNFPLLLACWKIAPALAMGNTVIIKPSQFTPLSVLRLAEILHQEKVLPPGVFNVLQGAAETGTAISHHPGIDKISFTGSTGVGARIVEGSAKSNLKTVTLELGGKAPNIIFNDVPSLSAAIDRSFQVMFSHKGEKCTEPTRFLIERGIYEEFSSRLVSKANAVKCGDPFRQDTQQGPQCYLAHFEKILKYIEIGKKDGSKLLVGGGPDTSAENKQGLYIRPTIFGDVDPKSKLFREEIFGPVLVLTPFDTEKEAIELANDTPYGLASGLYTSDTGKAHRVAAALDTGMVFVNHYGCYDFASPFGGFKQSGWGKEMAIHSLDSYTRVKSVWVRYPTEA